MEFQIWGDEGKGALASGSVNARFNEKTFILRTKRIGWLISDAHQLRFLLITAITLQALEIPRHFPDSSQHSSPCCGYPRKYNKKYTTVTITQCNAPPKLWCHYYANKHWCCPNMMWTINSFLGQFRLFLVNSLTRPWQLPNSRHFQVFQTRWQPKNSREVDITKTKLCYILCRDYNCSSITIRLWHNTHACFQFDASKKQTCQFFRRSRIAVESNAYRNFDHFHNSWMHRGIVVSLSNRNCDTGLRDEQNSQRATINMVTKTQSWNIPLIPNDADTKVVQ